MSMGSGGGQSGGAVVGGPTPNAATFAGMYQYNAAQQAAQAATQQTNDAINFLRQQYVSSFTNLKPYTTTGIQALNELNQYMGLQAYNPGSAPTPVNLETMRGKITDEQIKNYVNQNVALTPVKSAQGNDTAGVFLHPQYTGVGSDDPNILKIYQQSWGRGGKYANGVSYPGGITSMNSSSMASPQQNFGSLFLSDTNQMPGSGVGSQLKNIIRDYLANQLVQEQLPQYTQEKELYDFAKGLYDQYSAEGPLSSQQVQEKLMNQPGVQFQYNQGLDAIQRAASARGMLGSGRLLQSLADYGQGMASQQYGATLDRLSQLAGVGQQAATAQSGMAQNLGNAGAGLKASLGDTIANSYLAGGNALAQSVLAGNQQYKVIGGGGGGGGGLGSALGGAASLISSFSGLFG